MRNVKVFKTLKNRKFFPLYRHILGILSKAENGIWDIKNKKGNSVEFPLNLDFD